MKKLLVRLVRQSPAMIVAMLALFVALTGTAVATSSALIGSAQIKNNSITGADVKNKSLTPRDFRGSVRGPRGLRGLAGAPGAPGAQGAQGVQGVPGSSVFDAGIPAGKTVKGTWGFSGTAAGTHFTTVGLPVPAPTAIAAGNVNFALGTPNASDGDAACNGTAANPTAPAGKVCLYIGSVDTGVTDLAGFQYTSPPGPFGFSVRIESAGAVDARGVWAYTAPAAAAASAPAVAGGTGA